MKAFVELIKYICKLPLSKMIVILAFLTILAYFGYKLYLEKEEVEIISAPQEVVSE